jgi:broad specificity phosphatase PhoE
VKQLYFIRHGQSELNKAGRFAGITDTPLTKKGHEQAKQAGKAVKQQGLSFDIIVSSPLVRAHETAKYVARELGHEPDQIQLHDNLRERNFGVLEAQPQLGTELQQRYLIDESVIDAFEGAETLEQLHIRAKTAIAYLRSLPHDNILIVAHGAFGRALRREINGEPMHLRGKDYDNAEVVRLI